MKLEDMKGTAIQFFVLFVLMFVAQYTAIHFATSKSDNTGKFDLKPERILQDMSGRVVPVGVNQVWPFDISQNITIKVLGKKPIDELVVVVLEVDAVAPINKEAAAKENPNQKLPSKLKLSGRMKLTYEYFDKEWYLVSAENMALRATPLD